MNNRNETPFILRYEEEPQGDSVIDGLDEEFYYEPATRGMFLRTIFAPWETCATLKTPEV